MKESKSALVVGAGAIGAAVASRIFDADPGAVAICATGARRERYARDGFVVNNSGTQVYSCRGGRRGPSTHGFCAVKNYDLSGAIEAMKPYVGPDTTIISLLNGIGSEEILASEFGAGKVPLATIIGIDALRVGNEIRFASAGEIRFGEGKNAPEELKPRIAAAFGFFSSHNVRAVVPGDMVHTLWFKFMLNVGINQWSAVLRAPYGFFQTSPSSRALLADTMREVIALASARGTELNEGDIELVFATIDGLRGDGKTSMLQDIEAERKTEVEAFAGFVLENSIAFGLQAPINRALLLAIRAMEEGFPLGSKASKFRDLSR